MEREELVGPGEARVVLDEVSRLRAGTRRERQAFWFPALVFAVVALASALFYPPTHPFPASGVTVGAGGSSLGLLGGQVSALSASAGLYWLIAVPTGYLLTAAYYLWRARRRGVVSAWRIWTLTGFALFALVVFLLRYYWDFLPGDLTVRGLLPLVVIAVGFAVLATTQRSLEFGIFAAVFLALAMTANLYDMANLAQRVGVHADDGVYLNNLVTGMVLLVASAWFALRARGWRLDGTFRIVRSAP